MNIRNKLIAGFSIVIGLALVQGLFAVYEIGLMGQRAIETYDRPLLTINAAQSAKTNFVVLDREIARSGADATAAPDPPQALR